MLEVTIDLETCALCPNAAVMSVGAVAWQSENTDSPFFRLQDGNVDPWFSFFAPVDLRSQFMREFAFDKKTARWWSEQSEEAQKASSTSDSDNPCLPIEIVIGKLFSWISDRMKDLGEKDIRIWSQGTDFDIAIIKNVCDKFDITYPFDRNSITDHRTFFLTNAQRVCELRGIEYDQKNAYKLVKDYKTIEAGSVHAPVFDCKRSIYSTWQMMQLVNGIDPQG